VTGGAAGGAKTASAPAPDVPESMCCPLSPRGFHGEPGSMREAEVVTESCPRSYNGIDNMPMTENVKR
jgi:hypothetical protein